MNSDPSAGLVLGAHLCLLNRRDSRRRCQIGHLLAVGLDSGWVVIDLAGQRVASTFDADAQLAPPGGVDPDGSTSKTYSWHIPSARCVAWSRQS